MIDDKRLLELIDWTEEVELMFPIANKNLVREIAKELLTLRKEKEELHDAYTSLEERYETESVEFARFSESSLEQIKIAHDAIDKLREQNKELIDICGGFEHVIKQLYPLSTSDEILCSVILDRYNALIQEIKDE